MSILQASPSTRDSRSYISSFAPPAATTSAQQLSADMPVTAPSAVDGQETVPAPTPTNPIVSALLNPIIRRPALVKIQGPFKDHQLQAIAKGMAHLQKLGLVSVIVMDRDDIPIAEPSDSNAAQRQRTLLLRDVERLVSFLGKARAPARPVLATVARIGGAEKPSSLEGDEYKEGDVFVEGEGLDTIRRAVEEGEIPVLLPVALDTGCRSRRIGADKVLPALAHAMARSARSPSAASGSVSSRRIDLTPVRLLVINREGGIPSYARSGLPHLSINLQSEFAYIRDTFQPEWRDTHPTALSTLGLANACLADMPPDASALVVSHRSPAAMISNLITNKPAHSASLPHALLVESEGRITRDTPTLIRRGSPVRILRSLSEVDLPRLTALLEKSFKRTLNQKAFFARLERDLDFVIVIGDYAGAAIVTREPDGTPEGICYLDKFAVLPSHQGDGTVDFLWVALRDETYGLGLLDASNPSIGSLSGRGRGKDLVWRSRANNPVNKWYFERSNGFVRSSDGLWKMFWCDAEQRLRENAREEGREFGGGRLVRVVEREEEGRLARWEPAISAIKSAWL